MNLPMQDNTAGERSRRLPAAVSGGIRLSPKQAVRSVPTPSLGCQPTLPCQHVAARGVTGKTGGGGGGGKRQESRLPRKRSSLPMLQQESRRSGRQGHSMSISCSPLPPLHTSLGHSPPASCVRGRGDETHQKGPCRQASPFSILTPPPSGRPPICVSLFCM